MPWHPQGLGKLTRWKSRIGAVSLVAIGGLTPSWVPEFVAGANVAAVVTDMVTAAGPKARTRLWVLVVGAGGLGCTVISALAAAGVGRLTVVDPGQVAQSNLHRQTL